MTNLSIKCLGQLVQNLLTLVVFAMDSFFQWVMELVYPH